MKIALVTPTWPPFNCGIGDYSTFVAQKLSKENSVTVLTAKRQGVTSVSGLVVKDIFDPEKLSDIYKVADYVAKEQPYWIFLQYNPFSFHARGLNLYLPLMISNLKKRSPETRIAVMVHEACRPVENWRHNVSALWLNWSLWKTGQAADVLFFSNRPLA